MIIERKAGKLGGEVTRASLFLSRNLSQSFTVERSLEKKSLDLKKKIVEARGRTLRMIGSRDKDSQISGGIGGALGLLGLGFTRKLFRPRVPKTPGALLRMQRGANVSRAGQLGGLGRLARPIAIVGTGLDFIGRRAEGQTNVQAGVGAAGGLAGAIGGAKIGAAIGTAILPGAGTAIGGVGGSIIGSLAGGRIVDLFTGANRRRQFEEERTEIRGQKTLYSESLDDFDSVLDKFEDVIGFLAIRKDDDDGTMERRKRPSGFPKPPNIGERIKKFADKPAVQAIGVTAAIAGLITLAVFTRGKSATKSKPIIQELLKKTPALKDFTQKEQIAAIGRIIMKSLPKSTQQKIRMSTAPAVTKRGTVIPGQKGAPGRIPRDIVRQRSKARREKFLKKKERLEKDKLNKALDKASKLDQDVERQLSGVEDDIKILSESLRTGSLPEGVSRESFRKVLRSFQDVMADMLKKGGMSKGELDQILRNLRQIDKGKDIFFKESKNKPLDIELLLKRIKDVIGETPLGSVPKDLRIDPLDQPSTDIALADIAPRGNIFLINQQQGDNNINVNEDRGNLAMTRGNVDPYSTMITLAMFDTSLTT